MADFAFSDEDYSDRDSFILKAAENQVNRDTTGKETPLKTTASESPPQSTLTTVGISDAAMGSQLFMYEGVIADLQNRVGQDVIATGIGEMGGPQAVMGGAHVIAPNDMLLIAEQVAPLGHLMGEGGGIAGGLPNVGTGTLDLSEYPPNPGGYRSTSEMRGIYSIDGGTQPPPQGSPQYIASFTWWDGRTYPVHKATVPIWSLVSAIMKKYNYGPGLDNDGGGGQVVRRITGGSGWSLHSYGIAVDINPAQNPYSRTFQSDMPPGMIEEILSIRTAGGVRAVRWGGHYSNNKDAMHFEVVVTPNEIASGPLSLGGLSSSTTGSR